MTTALVLVDLQVAFGAPVARPQRRRRDRRRRGRRPRPAGHHAARPPRPRAERPRSAAPASSRALRARDADLGRRARRGRGERSRARAAALAGAAPPRRATTGRGGRTAEWALHPAFARLARRRDRRGGEAEAAGGGGGAGATAAPGTTATPTGSCSARATRSPSTRRQHARRRVPGCGARACELAIGGVLADACVLESAPARARAARLRRPFLKDGAAAATKASAAIAMPGGRPTTGAARARPRARALVRGVGLAV